MKNYGNSVSQKETDSSSEVKLKIMEYYNLTGRKFKITIMKELSESQETTKGGSAQ